MKGLVQLIIIPLTTKIFETKLLVTSLRGLGFSSLLMQTCQEVFPS